MTLKMMKSGNAGGLLDDRSAAIGVSVWSREQGRTLAEMLVVVSLLGTMLAITLPNIARLMSRNRVVDATRQVQSAMLYARMKGINERNNYVVQFTDTGWNIFSDLNNDGVRQTTEPWLYTVPFNLPKKVRFQYPSVSMNYDSLAISGCRCAVFQTDGSMQVSSTSITSRALGIGDGKDYRQISVSLVGSTKVQSWNPTRSKFE